MAKREPSKPLPMINSITKPFWEQTARDRFVLQSCAECKVCMWPPRPACIECGCESVDWRPVSGRGTLYSFTIIRQVAGRGSSKAFERDIPYVVGWIDLEEGPRIVSNLIGCALGELKIGMRVTVLFEQASDDIWLPKFQPSS